MKITITGYGLVIILALLSVSGDSSEPPPFPADPAKPPAPPKSEAELRAILRQTCDEADRFYKAEGFPISVSSSVPCSFKLQDEHFDNETLAEFDASTQQENMFRAQMLATSGRYVNFFNWAVDHANSSYAGGGTPSSTKWTEEHAIEVASKFSDIFVKPWGTCLGKAVAQSHGLISTSGSPLEPGNWEVRWGVQSPSGIPYEFGGVKVNLSEKYGPSIVSIWIGTSPYDDEHITPIPQDMALNTASSGLDALLNEEGEANGVLHNAQILSEKPTFSLLIVQPSKDSFYQPKSLPDSGFLNQSKARLAWKVTYEIRTSDQYTHGALSIYVDAKDGRILCCTNPIMLMTL